MRDVGDSTVLTARFFDDDGALADPTTVTLAVTEPDGTVTTYSYPPAGTITRVSLGVYEAPLTFDAAGVWTVTWTGTGTVVQVETVRYVVGGPRTGPCASWVSSEDVFDCGAVASVAEADRDYALATRLVRSASEVLFLLSGSRFPGVCRDVVRPCRRSVHYSQPGWDGWGSTLWGTCACQAPPPHRSCGCPMLDEVTLGGSPVLGIESVYVDGALLDPSAYRVDDSRYLVRIDDEGWPCCQDLTADPTADDSTFQVAYFYGVEPPEVGLAAARSLAAELYLSCTGGDCSLPQRVQTITRQGMTMALLDPFDFLDEGKTGVYDVDLFLKAYNPHGRTGMATIASPDVPRRVRRVGS